MAEKRGRRRSSRTLQSSVEPSGLVPLQEPTDSSAHAVQIPIAWVGSGLAALAGDTSLASFSVEGLFSGGALSASCLGDVSGSVSACAAICLDPAPEGWPASREKAQCLLCHEDSSRRFFVVAYSALLGSPSGSPPRLLASAWHNVTQRRPADVVRSPIPDRGGWIRPLRGRGVGTDFPPPAEPAPPPVVGTEAQLAAQAQASDGAAGGAAAHVLAAAPRAGPPAEARNPGGGSGAGRAGGLLPPDAGAEVGGGARESPVAPRGRNSRPSRPRSPTVGVAPSVADVDVPERLPLDPASDVVLLGAVPLTELPGATVAVPRSGSHPALLLSHTSRTGAPAQWAWVEAAESRAAVADVSAFLVRRARAPERASAELVEHGAVLVLALVTVQGGSAVGTRSVVAVCGAPPRLHVFCHPKKNAPLSSIVKAWKRKARPDRHPQRSLCVRLGDPSGAGDVHATLYALVHDPRGDGAARGAARGQRPAEVTALLWQQVLVGPTVATAAATAARGRALAAAAEAVAAAEAAAAATAAAAEAAAAAADVAPSADESELLDIDVSTDLRVSIPALVSTAGGFAASQPAAVGKLVGLTAEAAALAARFSPREKWRPPPGAGAGAAAVGAGIAERNAALDPLARVAVISRALAARTVVPAPSPDSPRPATAPAPEGSAAGAAGAPHLLPTSIPFSVPAGVLGLAVPLQLGVSALRTSLCALLQPVPGAPPAVVAEPGRDDDREDRAAAVPLPRASLTSFISVSRGMSGRLVHGEVAFAPSGASTPADVPLAAAVRALVLLARSDFGLEHAPPPPRGGAQLSDASADNDYFLSVHPAATVTENAAASSLLGGAVDVRRADAASTSAGRPVGHEASRAAPAGGDTSIAGSHAFGIPCFSRLRRMSRRSETTSNRSDDDVAPDALSDVDEAAAEEAVTASREVTLDDTAVRAILVRLHVQSFASPPIEAARSLFSDHEWLAVLSLLRTFRDVHALLGLSSRVTETAPRMTPAALLAALDRTKRMDFGVSGGPCVTVNLLPTGYDEAEEPFELGVNGEGVVDALRVMLRLAIAASFLFYRGFADGYALARCWLSELVTPRGQTFRVYHLPVVSWAALSCMLAGWGKAGAQRAGGVATMVVGRTLAGRSRARADMTGDEAASFRAGGAEAEYVTRRMAMRLLQLVGTNSPLAGLVSLTSRLANLEDAFQYVGVGWNVSSAPGAVTIAMPREVSNRCGLTAPRSQPTRVLQRSAARGTGGGVGARRPVAPPVAAGADVFGHPPFLRAPSPPTVPSPRDVPAGWLPQRPAGPVAGRASGPAAGRWTSAGRLQRIGEAREPLARGRRPGLERSDDLADALAVAARGHPAPRNGVVASAKFFPMLGWPCSSSGYTVRLVTSPAVVVPAVAKLQAYVTQLREAGKGVPLAGSAEHGFGDTVSALHKATPAGGAVWLDVSRLRTSTQAFLRGVGSALQLLRAAGPRVRFEETTVFRTAAGHATPPEVSSYDFPRLVHGLASLVYNNVVAADARVLEDFTLLVAAALTVGATACSTVLARGGLSPEVQAAVVDLYSVINAHIAHFLDGRLPRELAPAFTAFRRVVLPFIPRVVRAVLGLSEDGATPVGVVLDLSAPAPAAPLERAPWPGGAVACETCGWPCPRGLYALGRHGVEFDHALPPPRTPPEPHSQAELERAFGAIESCESAPVSALYRYALGGCDVLLAERYRHHTTTFMRAADTLRHLMGGEESVLTFVLGWRPKDDVLAERCILAERALGLDEDGGGWDAAIPPEGPSAVLARVTAHLVAQRTLCARLRRASVVMILGHPDAAVAPHLPCLLIRALGSVVHVGWRGAALAVVTGSHTDWVLPSSIAFHRLDARGSVLGRPAAAPATVSVLQRVRRVVRISSAQSRVELRGAAPADVPRDMARCAAVVAQALTSLAACTPADAPSSADLTAARCGLAPQSQTPAGGRTATPLMRGVCGNATRCDPSAAELAFTGGVSPSRLQRARAAPEAAASAAAAAEEDALRRAATAASAAAAGTARAARVLARFAGVEVVIDALAARGERAPPTVEEAAVLSSFMRWLNGRDARDLRPSSTVIGREEFLVFLADAGAAIPSFLFPLARAMDAFTARSLDPGRRRDWVDVAFAKYSRAAASPPPSAADVAARFLRVASERAVSAAYEAMRAMGQGGASIPVLSPPPLSRAAQLRFAHAVPAREPQQPPVVPEPARRRFEWTPARCVLYWRLYSSVLAERARRGAETHSVAAVCEEVDRLFRPRAAEFGLAWPSARSLAEKMRLVRREGGLRGLPRADEGTQTAGLTDADVADVLAADAAEEASALDEQQCGEAGGGSDADEEGERAPMADTPAEDSLPDDEFRRKQPKRRRSAAITAPGGPRTKRDRRRG